MVGPWVTAVQRFAVVGEDGGILDAHFSPGTIPDGWEMLFGYQGGANRESPAVSAFY